MRSASAPSYNSQTYLQKSGQLKQIINIHIHICIKHINIKTQNLFIIFVLLTHM